MKKFVLSVLCALVSISAYGQGTIALSNILKTPVTVDGVAAPAGTLVSFATTDNSLVGGQGSVLGGGFFSAGTQTLDGLTGDVSLKLAGSADGGASWAYSDAFSVTLGGSGTPPAPAAAIPNGVALDITTAAIPEPSTIALAVLGGAALMFRRRK